MSNVILNPGVGGATCATDQISAVDHQLVKVEWGAAGTATQASIVNPIPVQSPPLTSGGYSNSSILSAASINATVIKASAGQVYGVHVYNNSGVPIYVRLYNKGSSPPAPASDAALITRRIGVQAGTQRDMLFPSGQPFAAGIGIVITKGIADTDTTAVALNDCMVELEWA